jgi:hypothetical protein
LKDNVDATRIKSMGAANRDLSAQLATVDTSHS